MSTIEIIQQEQIARQDSKLFLKQKKFMTKELNK